MGRKTLPWGKPVRLSTPHFPSTEGAAGECPWRCCEDGVRWFLSPAQPFRDAPCPLPTSGPASQGGAPSVDTTYLTHGPDGRGRSFRYRRWLPGIMYGRWRHLALWVILAASKGGRPLCGSWTLPHIGDGGMLWASMTECAASVSLGTSAREVISDGRTRPSAMSRGHRQCPEWHLERHFPCEPGSAVCPCSQASRPSGARPGLRRPGMLASI